MANQGKAQLHLLHMSSRHGMSDGATLADLRWSMKQGADIITYTETPDSQALLRTAGEENGYAVSKAFTKNEAFAFNNKTARMKSIDGMVASLPFSDGLPGHPRYCSWAHVIWRDTKLAVTTGHFLFHLVQSEARRKSHAHMCRVFSQKAEAFGTSGALSFYTGDMNDDDEGQQLDVSPRSFEYISRQHNLNSIWDETNTYPSKRIIDLIGHWTPDKRIKPLKAVRYPKQNSDHFPIGAFYEITGVGDASPSTPPGGGAQAPNPHEDPHNYLSSKYSWKDYRDRVVYPINTAIEDDDHDHGI